MPNHPGKPTDDERDASAEAFYAGTGRGREITHIRIGVRTAWAIRRYYDGKGSRA
jgi:hypothetical protein